MKPEIISSLKNYHKRDLIKDLMAGLMVAIIALPLSIALGIQSVPEQVSGNGIQFGIITAIVAGFFISALGGSRFQIGGPTAAFVVILYSYIANPDIGLLGLALAGMMAGVLLILMGALRLGRVMKYFPYPITIGFTTGIGITLLIGQIKDFCGLQAEGTEALEKLISYAENIKTFDLATFAVGTAGLLCILLLPRLTKKIPPAFVALILCTLLTFLLNRFAGAEIATIGSKYGQIRAGFFPIDFSGIGSVKFTALIVPAFVIAFLCAIESLLSATVAAGMTGTSFNASQELIGQGVANIFSSLLGGLPATGAIARTAAGIKSGAKSPLTGVFHALFVLIMYFSLMSVVGYIPLAVFSAILISVAINMSRFPLFLKLTRFGVRDVIILLVTCALTVVFDLTYGVLGGIVVTFLVNAKNIRIGLSIETDAQSATVKPCGTVFFLNAGRLVDRISAATEEADTVTVDLAGVQRIDQTGLEKLAALDRALRARGKAMTFVGQNAAVQNRFDRFFAVL